MRFEDLPEEIQAVMVRQQMELEAARASLDSFLFGLGKDDMLTLANFLDLIGSAADPSNVAHYYEGMLRGTIRAKFDVCEHHGINHEAEALAAMEGSTVPRHSPSDEVQPNTQHGDLVANAVATAALSELDGIMLTSDDPDVTAAMADFDPANPDATVLGDMADIMAEAATIEAEYASIEADLAKYNIGFTVFIDTAVNDYSPDDLRNATQVSCMNCGITYSSIADRMLKEPNDCHGCHVKAAHG